MVKTHALGCQLSQETHPYQSHWHIKRHIAEYKSIAAIAQAVAQSVPDLHGNTSCYETWTGPCIGLLLFLMMQLCSADK